VHGVPAHVTTSQLLDSVSPSPIVTSSHVDSFDALQQRDIKNYVKFYRKGKFYFALYGNGMPKQKLTMFLVCLI
jgi:hypothetical protein